MLVRIDSFRGRSCKPREGCDRHMLSTAVSGYGKLTVGLPLDIPRPYHRHIRDDGGNAVGVTTLSSGLRAHLAMQLVIRDQVDPSGQGIMKSRGMLAFAGLLNGATPHGDMFGADAL